MEQREVDDDRTSGTGDRADAWRAARQRDAPWIIPARRLAASVMLQAISDLHTCRAAASDQPAVVPMARGAVRKVAAWFASDATDWPFAFRNLCEALDLDPAEVRRGLGIVARRHTDRERDHPRGGARRSW